MNHFVDRTLDVSVILGDVVFFGRSHPQRRLPAVGCPRQHSQTLRALSSSFLEGHLGALHPPGTQAPEFSGGLELMLYCLPGNPCVSNSA